MRWLTIRRLLRPGKGLSAATHRRARTGRLLGRLRRVRKVAIVLLVLLVLLVALPLGMGMAMGVCPNSHLPACANSTAMCFAFVALLALFPLLVFARTPIGSASARRLLLAMSLERPPRLR